MMLEQDGSSTCEVVILTALGLERQAVLAHLQNVQKIVHPGGTIYHWGSFSGKHRLWRVAVAEIGIGGPPAAVETERAISYFHPEITFFVGIAGGLKDVQIGDVVAAIKVYSYESGKVAQRFEPRPEVWRASYALEQCARAEVHQDDWLLRLGDLSPEPRPRVFVGALAAGEKVVSSKRSSIYLLLQAIYGDALAVEMEGHGFLQAVHANHTVYALVVRGISDLIEEKTKADASGSQQRAARHAAAFAFELLAKFTLPQQGHVSSFPSPWMIPFPRNPFFTGREDMLRLLHEQLQRNKTLALSQPKAISGLGGIGKTQLAIEYAYRFHQDYQTILWARAESTEALNSSYADIARQLSLPEKDEQKQAVTIEAVKKWLRTHQSWLFILDNADEPDVLLPFLPAATGGHLLLTTRATALRGLGISSPIEVEIFTPEQGALFLLHRAGLLALDASLDLASPQDHDLAIKIAQELGALPLALDQAGAYIEATSCSLSEYQQIYQQHRTELLQERRTLVTDHPEPVATTWSLSFTRVEEKSPAAAELLQLCAYLSSDAIAEEIISQGAPYLGPLLAPVAADPFLLNQAMEALRAYSLVARDPNAKTLSVHRLVQVVLQDALPAETGKQWMQRAVLAVNAALPDVEFTSWAIYERCLLHALLCTTWIEHQQMIFPEAARLLNQVGRYLTERARYAEAEPLYQRSLAIRERHVGAEHSDTSESLNNLGNLYAQLGRYTEAKLLLKRALTIDEKVSGPEHPNTAIDLNNLAVLYREQGCYAEAEPLYQRALAIDEKIFGPEHPDTAVDLNNLSSL
jgi:nucleoside phosphorylase